MSSKKSFKKYLDEATNSPDLDVTAPYDTAGDIAKELSAEDYMKIKEQLQNVMGDTRMRKILASKGLESYAKQIPGNLAKAKNLVAKLSKGSKVVVPIAGGLLGGIAEAADLPEAGDMESEQQELQKAKAEHEFSQLPLEKQKLLNTIHSKSKDIAEQPIKPEELLNQKSVQEIATPMIKQLGGSADINPNQVKQMAGEQPSPDIEQPALNYQDHLQKQKKRMGY